MSTWNLGKCPLVQSLYHPMQLPFLYIPAEEGGVAILALTSPAISRVKVFLSMCHFVILGPFTQSRHLAILKHCRDERKKFTLFPLLLSTFPPSPLLAPTPSSLFSPLDLPPSPPSFPPLSPSSPSSLPHHSCNLAT